MEGMKVVDRLFLRIQKHKVSSLGSVFARIGWNWQGGPQWDNYNGPEAAELLSAWEAQIAERYRKPRSIARNAVGVVELLLAVGEAEPGAIPAEGWHCDCRVWTARKFNRQNILVCVTHSGRRDRAFTLC